VGFPLVDADALKVFILGSFRDYGSVRPRSVRLLGRLVSALRDLGWDAFLSGDDRSLEIAGGDLEARPMTQRLDDLCDLAVFVVTTTGREAGWASELAALQAKRPEGAAKRLLMVPEAYELSWILDPSRAGILGDPPLRISRWSDEQDLVNQVSAYATFLGQWGRLPTPLEYRP